MTDQKTLYLYNLARINDPLSHRIDILNYESSWIASTLGGFSNHATSSSLKDFCSKFDHLIELESGETPESALYVRDRMHLDEFRLFIQEFAVDGLTEAQVFYYIMPRLSLEAQMPMLRILIDEFGSANPKRTHTALFRSLLSELDMPTDPKYYIERMDDISFEFLNVFFWLTLRADDPSYFVGALTYLETIIPVVFPYYECACKRLGVEASDYYSEHCHIDQFHSIEGFRILRAMDRSGSLCPGRAWQGVLLASTITNKVFDNAVEIARSSRSRGSCLAEAEEDLWA